MFADSERLGKCQVCESEDAKYTCPRCEMRTCCLQCVKNHKTEMKCDGVRDKTAYKPLSQFSNLDFLSDYRLLEDISQSVDTFARDQSKRYSRSRGDLPRHLFMLREAAHLRGMRLWFLPQNFTRHKSNTTYLDWKTKIVSWKVQWMFPEAENDKTSIEDKRVCELSILKDCIQSKIDENISLSIYKQAGINNLTVLLRAENRRKASTTYFSLNMDKSLKDNLHGHTLVEHPVMYVIMSQHVVNYTIISLEQGEEDEMETNNGTCTSNTASIESSTDVNSTESGSICDMHTESKRPKLIITMQ